MPVPHLFALILFLATTLSSASANSAETDLPLSLATSNSLVQEQFPITVDIGPEKVFLTAPEIIFVDAERIAVRARFQAYDHRPDERIAVSETGNAQLSGELDFDPVKRQFLIHNPTLDALDFDGQSSITERLRQTIVQAWQEHVGNPLRANIPPHPYLGVMKDYISGLDYDGESILLRLSF